MTDGIIQKVFKEYINMENNIKKKGYASFYETTEELLMELQKELIEEINKNVSEWSKQNNTPLPRYVKLDVLIGDSK